MSFVSVVEHYAFERKDVNEMF